MSWETLHMLRSLADFGMFVVLWLVQLVIYPSFLHVSSDRLIGWHRIYTFRVSFVIMPLMLAQLILVLVFAWTTRSLADFSAFFLVLTCWILTFGVSVPLHRRVAAGQGDYSVLESLVRTNWARTVLWSAVLFLGWF